MRIIGFGTYDRRRHPRVGTVLEGLAAAGDEVLELNVPLGFSTSERVQMLAKPGSSWRLALRMAVCWVRLVGLRLRRLGWRPDAIVVGYLGQFDVLLARVLFPRTPIVLDLLIFGRDTARDRGVGGGRIMSVLKRLDDLAARCASIIMVDTAEHGALVGPAHAHKVVAVPVGAPADWFVTRDEPAGTSAGPLRVVFYGLFTPLQGAPVIAQAIALTPPTADVTFTMIGSGQDLGEAHRLTAGRSVTWIDWVEPDELPRIVAAHDVCLGIFSDNDKARRVVPNKAFQGAAAGCVVLTSDTAPQRRALREAARYVPAEDPQALAAELIRLSGRREEVRALGEAAAARAKEAFGPVTIAAALRPRLRAVSHRAGGALERSAPSTAAS